MEIILASESLRRKELMEMMGFHFRVVVSNIDETVDSDLPVHEYVRALARRKAESVATVYPDACVIGCDTVVFLDGRIMGKPHTAKRAAEYLRALQGRTHAVYSGIAVVAEGRCDVRFDRTEVTFAPMSEKEIKWYVSVGNPFDKAGAYGIQGPAGLFVEKIDGNYFNVVGLPVPLLYKMLKENGILSFGTVSE